MSNNKARFSVSFEDEMLEKIDDFRFANRYPNRTKAILELIQIGLDTVEASGNISKATTEGLVHERKEK